MSRFFKSALFPILIVVVLAFFASKLISRSNQAPARSFAGFLEQVENGQVQTATLRTKDNSIDVRLKGTDKNKYQVGYPLDYSD
ncbi:MAG: cell division protease FtsH, partial [Solirubrobacteraceae bacterium]|nr:cell division protease FtsH [Solirubrobacteraceae bacterium]